MNHTTTTKFRKTVTINPTKIGYFVQNIKPKISQYSQEHLEFYHSQLRQEIKQLTGIEPDFLGLINSERDFETVRNFLKDDYNLIFLTQVEFENPKRSKEIFETTVRTMILFDSIDDKPMLMTRHTIRPTKYSNQKALISSAIAGALCPYTKKEIFQH